MHPLLQKIKMQLRPFNLLIASIIAINVHAQDTISIQQEEVLRRASTGNFSNNLAAIQEKTAKADYRQSNAIYLPSLGISHTAMMTTNPLMSFGFKLNQETVEQPDFNPILLNDPDIIRDYATRIEVTQPLFNIDGIFGRSAAHAQLEATRLQTIRTQQATTMQTISAYKQLQLAYKAVEVLNKALITSKENEKIAKQFIEQGYLQQADLIAVQIRVSEVEKQLLEATGNLKNASDFLAFQMGEQNSSVIYKPVEESQINLEPTTYDAALNLQRADILAITFAEEAYKKMLQKDKASLLPRLNAFGWYELHDKEIFGTDANGYLIGASLSWQLFDGYSSIGKTEKAKAELQKSGVMQEQYIAQSQLELKKAQRALSTAAKSLSLARLAEQQAKEAYRIRENRFKQGMEKVTDLLNAETIQAQKALELQQATYQYQLTEIYVQFLSH